MSVWILYSGYGNIGDEAILLGTLRILGDFHLVNRVKVLDVYPRLPKKFDSIGFEYVSLDDILGPRSLRPLRYIPSVSKFFIQGVPRRADIRGLLWHRGGSGYDGYHGWGLLMKSASYSTALASLFENRVLGGLSTGFTKNTFERLILRHFISVWDWILLREHISYHYIKNLYPKHERVALVHDFAIHVDKEETKRSGKMKDLIKQNNKRNNLICLILRDYFYQNRYPSEYRIRYFSFIRNLIRALARHEFGILVLPLGYMGARDNDIKFYWELRDMGVLDSGVNILSDVIKMTPSELVDVLSVFDYVISVRTHGFILANLAGTPTLNLYYEHKGKGITKFTFNTEGYDLHYCLFDESCVPRIVRQVEERTRNKYTAFSLQRAREHNKRTVGMILKEHGSFM